MADGDTTCRSLYDELQRIWNEIGETDAERDKMLLQLEQECLDVYRRKVDQANCARARLHQTLADSEAELASLLSSLGDRPCIIEKRSGTLRQQLMSITPQIEALRLKKEERIRQFQEVKHEIQTLSNEMSSAPEPQKQAFVEEDMSLRKLHEYHSQLQALQTQKKNRLLMVLEHVNALHELCAVLGINFPDIAQEIHPSLGDSTIQCKSTSDETLDRLAKTTESLHEEKRQRLQKLQNLATSLVELWNLMDIHSGEQQQFKSITGNLVPSEHANSFCEPGSLALEIIEQAEAEVDRLRQLKVSKMKELVLKKQAELEEICRLAHMECDSNLAPERLTNLLDSGVVDPSELLATIEENIGKAKEESLSRKDIMEKMEKWIVACAEESWLEDYNKDENRFNATRGAHLNLKRAERARVITTKLPTLLESLKSKTRAWEDERGRPFLYNGVSLLAMLEEYNLLRREKEEEKRRLREQKKMQEQLQTEQEILYGTHNLKRGQGGLRPSGNYANPRLSLGPELLVAPRVNNGLQKGGRDNKKLPPVLNYVALAKDEACSISSGGSSPGSPVAV